MGEALFYHLTRRPLAQVLPPLVERALGRGWRVLVRGGNPRHLEQIDAALWTHEPGSFLPHGMAGGPHDAVQPVLLATDPGAGTDRDCLFLIDGAGTDPAETGARARTCILFDGTDPGQLDHARGLWRNLNGSGTKAQYWSEETGRWELKAET